MARRGHLVALLLAVGIGVASACTSKTNGGTPSAGTGGTSGFGGVVGSGASGGVVATSSSGGAPSAAGAGPAIGGSGGTGTLVGGAPSPGGGGASPGSVGGASGATPGAGGAPAGTAGVSNSAGQAGSGTGGAAAVDAGPPKTPADYAQPGPYGSAKRLLNQGTGTITGGSQALLPLGNSNDPSGFTVYYPTGGSATERLPLLTWGNGTFCSPTFYDELIGFVVSYGFIVVGANTSNVGTGVEMLKAVDWAFAQDQDAQSPIHGRVDHDHVGAFGHSQGGAGTCMAGADPRIKAIAPLSGAPLSDRRDASVDIQCPTFYVTTEGDIATPDSIQQVYDFMKVPTAFGVTNGGNHDDYTDIADDPHISGLTSNDGKRARAAIAAWFDWQLKGRANLRSLFVGPSCGFCKDANWKMFESKGF